MPKKAIISGIIFSSILLVGCNGEPEVVVLDDSKNGENDANLSLESNFLSGLQNEMLMDDVSDIKEISISKSTVLGKLNDEYFATFEDTKELDTLKNAFLTAKREKIKLEGVNYDLLITDDKGGNYLLQCYLGEEGEKSAFFFIGHEDKVYFTSKEITQELRKILNP